MPVKFWLSNLRIGNIFFDNCSIMWKRYLTKATSPIRPNNLREIIFRINCKIFNWPLELSTEILKISPCIRRILVWHEFGTWREGRFSFIVNIFMIIMDIFRDNNMDIKMAIILNTSPTLLDTCNHRLRGRKKHLPNLQVSPLDKILKQPNYSCQKDCHFKWSINQHRVKKYSI